MKRRRIVHWYEQDVHTGWRRCYAYFRRPGRAKQLKTMTNRRERREGKRECEGDE
jgi:hypothetical protein